MHLDALHRLIANKGQAAGISEYEVEDAKFLFHPVFDWSQRDSWFHAPPKEFTFGPDRVLTAEIAEATNGYMQLGWLRAEELDWLLADAMTFGEVNATFKNMSPNRFYFQDGEPVVWMMALKALFQLALWAVWLVALYALYSASGVMAAILVVATAAYQYAKRRRLRKLGELLASMAATYDALDACPPSWRNLYALMEKSRDLGAKWPTPLYRLVERNLPR